MFYKFDIEFDVDLDSDLFNTLSKCTEFENIIEGRVGANLIDCKTLDILAPTEIGAKNYIVPLVRTTTVYNKPSQKMLQIHYDVIDKIKKTSKMENLNFNNAMIEIYDNRYKTMGFHTDQSLDLNSGSYICIFSCYENPSLLASSGVRKLQIKNKETNECSEVVLSNCSAILFSLDTNSKHLHKIVLDNNNANNTRWLGITFRLSKTFIEFVNEIPYFWQTNKVLRLANDMERKQFMKLKGLENQNIKYEYPELDYTVCTSDLTHT